LRDDYINNPVGISSLISGLMKNISLHLSTPLRPVNLAIYGFVEIIHNLIKVTINNEGLITPPYRFIIVPSAAVEYYAPNTLHLMLYLVSYLHLIKLKEKKIISFFTVTIIGFVIFSALIRWQPSFSRLHLPIFLMASPTIPFAVMRWKKWLKKITLLLLIASTFYFLFFNKGKTIFFKSPILFLPREEQYFRNWILPWSQYDLYKNVTELVKKSACKKTGLIYHDDVGYINEYSMWIMLKEQNNKIIINHVDVENQTKIFSSNNFVPDCIIFLSKEDMLIEKHRNKKIPVFSIYD